MELSSAVLDILLQYYCNSIARASHYPLMGPR